jgi:hypothetical protein
MTATFRCLASGNLVTFTAQVDIDSMKGHEGYVQEQTNEETKANETPSSSKEVLSKKSPIAKKTVTSTEEGAIYG